MLEAESNQLCVPANAFPYGKGPSQEPHRQFACLHGYRNLNNLLNLIVHDRRFIADLLVGTPSTIHRRRQQIWIPTVLLYFILFDVDSGHGDHSGEHLLFVGCIVN